MNYNFIFGSLIYRNSKDQDGDDDHEYDYEIVCKLEIFAHAFCMRATFDNRPIWAAAAAAVAARSIHSSNIKHTYNMTNSCTLTSRPSQADTYTHKCTHMYTYTYTDPAHAELLLRLLLRASKNARALRLWLWQVKRKLPTLKQLFVVASSVVVFVAQAEKNIKAKHSHKNAMQ